LGRSRSVVTVHGIEPDHRTWDTPNRGWQRRSVGRRLASPHSSHGGKPAQPPASLGAGDGLEPGGVAPQGYESEGVGARCGVRPRGASGCRARANPWSAWSMFLIASERRPRVADFRFRVCRRGVVSTSASTGGAFAGSSRTEASRVSTLHLSSRAITDASTTTPSERRRVRIPRVGARTWLIADARAATCADCAEASS